MRKISFNDINNDQVKILNKLQSANWDFWEGVIHVIEA